MVKIRIRDEKDEYEKDSDEMGGDEKGGDPLSFFDNKVLDLYELYNLVVEKGGLVEVINKKQWQEIIKVIISALDQRWFDQLVFSYRVSTFPSQ